MKNKFIYRKSLIALAMAATMILGEASVVMADSSSTSAAKTDVVGAYDGSVSKVIGLNETGISNKAVGYDNHLDKADGTAVPYYYVNKNAQNSSVVVSGNLQYTVDANGNYVYNVQDNGFYLYNGVYYESASYDRTSDMTTFSKPATDILGRLENINQYVDPATGLIVVNGAYYTSVSLTWTYNYYYSANKAIAIAEGDLTISLDEEGNKKSTANEYGFYSYNGKYYADATYVNSNKYNYNADTNVKANYTKFSSPVTIVTDESTVRDEKNRLLVDLRSKTVNGTTIKYYYDGDINTYSTDVSVVEKDYNGNLIVKKDIASGFYLYNGQYYYDAKVYEKESVNGVETAKTIRYTHPVTSLYNMTKSYTKPLSAYNKDYNAYLIDGVYYTVYSKSLPIYYVNADNAITPLQQYKTSSEADKARDALRKTVDGVAYDENATMSGEYYYDVNGVPYTDVGCNHGTLYAIESNNTVIKDGFASRQDAYKFKNESYNSASGKYVIDGVEYSGSSLYIYAHDVYTLFVDKDYQIAFGNKMYPTISWNPLSIDEKEVTADGKKVYIGYEIKVDDVLITNTNDSIVGGLSSIKNGTSEVPVMITGNSSVKIKKLLAEGESVKVQVRGVYYTYKKTKVPETTALAEYDQTIYTVYKTGDWSDAYTYTRASTTINPVADLNAKNDGSVIKLTWSAIPQAKKAQIYEIATLNPVTIADKETLESYINKKADDIYYTRSFDDVNPAENVYKASKNETHSYYDKVNDKNISGNIYKLYPYHYFVMEITDCAKGYNVAEGYSNIALLDAADAADTPVVKNLHVEYSTNGEGTIAWNATDSTAKVVVYAYEKKNLPQYFNYLELNPRSKNIEVHYNKLTAKRVEVTAAQVKNPAFVYRYNDNNGGYITEAFTNDGVNFYSRFATWSEDENGKIIYVFRENDRIDASRVMLAEGSYEVLNADGSYTWRYVVTDYEDTGKSYYNLDDKYQYVDDTYVGQEQKYFSTELNRYDRELANIADTVYKTKAVYSDGGVALSDFSNYYGDRLKPGVKYYFVAYTYDDFNSNFERTPIINYNGRDYVYYNDMSQPSKVISAKRTVAGANVAVSVAKTSVKLTMSPKSGATSVSGYVIYRMNDKGKYKKIATTTNNEYKDTNLKTGKSYTYKVVTFNYNPDSKVKTVSKESTVVYATPSSVSKFNVKTTMNSTNKVKVSWTKVPKAAKYEVYRLANTYDGDYKVVNTTNPINGDKWTLVKTIKKASTTSYIDKVKQGAGYSYCVVAYFKENGKLVNTRDYSDIYMGLQNPANVKIKVSGSKIKISWDADKYAKGYEIKYVLTDKYGNPTKNILTTKKTTKTSCTISGAATGASAIVVVRAYDKSGKYSSYSYAEVEKNLSVTKSIKAAYSAKKKAVKVSWKAVKGAKYYKVYRSTVSAGYNNDEKKYYATGTLIAAEGNDDEYYDRVVYKQYLDISGSVVGTSAYDYADLEDGVTYYYTVVAFGENGTQIASTMKNGSYASGKPASVRFNPTKVTLSSVKNVKKGQAKLTFKKVKGVKSYIILRSTKKNGKYEKIGTAKKTASTYIDKKAKKGKTYYYKVVAVKTNGLGVDVEYTSAAKGVKIKK